MLFNSFLFAGFFVLVFLVHAVLPHRARNALLLLASYVFYATWDWRFLALIWFSTALDFFVAQRIHATEGPARRHWLLVSVVGNLALLGFFKYYNFFIDSLDVLLAPFGTSAASLHLDIVLPLGISFYTFQTMAYTIDVYRRHMEPVRRLADFALFICFFPQLVAGPIERAGRLMPQIQNPRRITRDDLHEGMAMAVWGLFKKVFVADNLARIVDPVYALGAQPAGVDVLVATLAFTFQVYADFSAYSDIARGTARMLGFDLVRNFDAPYFSRDPGEFWRRWHVSLGTWLRDYLYVPLGGNRGSEARVSFNLWLTFFLSGLWHGSDGTFLLFGAYHGVAVAATRRFRQRVPVRHGSSRVPGALFTVLVFAVGLVLFRGQTVSQCMGLYAAMLTDLHWKPNVLPDLLRVLVFGSPLVLFDALRARAGISDWFVLGWSPWARWATYVLVFYALVLFGRSDGLDFVYFQF